MVVMGTYLTALDNNLKKTRENVGKYKYKSSPEYTNEKAFFTN